MDCGIKRKLDCVTDMDVLVQHGLPPFEDDSVDEHVKKMRLSLQLSTAAVPSIIATASSSSPPPSASSFLDGFSTVDSIVDEGWSSLSLASASGGGGGGGGPGPSDYWTCTPTQLHQHGRQRQGTSVAGTAGTVDSEEEMWEDIPSTTEVINSLRKVILWMSAQGDHNNDYIQYLSEVEKYAKSKQLNAAQQRKITQYLIRR